MTPTIDEKLKDIIKKTIAYHICCNDIPKGIDEKNIIQVLHSIKTVIREVLPSRKKEFIKAKGIEYSVMRAMNVGYNQCLREIKETLNLKKKERGDDR